MFDEPVTAATFADAFEANLAKARLEDAGIQALITGDQIESTWHLTSTFGGVKLVVARRNLAEAQEVLQQWGADGESSNDSVDFEDQ